MRRIRRNREKGMSLLELIFAGFVMVVGMLGSLILIMTAIASNTRNRIDTTGTAVSQLVIEQINALSGKSDTAFTITDCKKPTPNTWTVKVAGGTISAGGAGATLIASGTWNLRNNINYTQDYTAVPDGYKMKYETCGGTIYDVRWNIVRLTDYTRAVTVSSRQLGISGQTSNNIRLFAPPITIRTISGP